MICYLDSSKEAWLLALLLCKACVLACVLLCPWDSCTLTSPTCVFFQHNHIPHLPAPLYQCVSAELRHALGLWRTSCLLRLCKQLSLAQVDSTQL